MKKILTLLVMLAIAVSASAQLTMKQVLENAEKSISLDDGIKGKVTAKAMGIGETADFATNGLIMYTSNGNELSWESKEISNTIDKKKKTLTIEDGSEDYVIALAPFGMPTILLDADASKKAKVTDLKMKTEKSQYVFTYELAGQSMVLEIDKQTFHVKCWKIKKAFVTLMSFSYANLSKLTDKSILTFDKSKYVGYKIIDERGKDKKKK